jgi:uncharacterized protein YciI
VHYLLFYEKVMDYAERQTPRLREDHSVHLRAAVQSGELLLGGSLANPTDGSALLLFRSDSLRSAEAFAKADPYVIAGIVSRWYVRAWETVVGESAERPLAAS